MRIRFLTVLFASALFAAVALYTGPPSLDATDGGEFAVCGANLQIAHAPGYPLFLLLLRCTSIVLSPLYGHMRLINCLFAGLLVPLSVTAFTKKGAGFQAALMATVLFLASAPVITQMNSLEVYPMAMVLTMAAIALSDSKLMPYVSGMAIFTGHPTAVICSPLMFRRTKILRFLPLFLLPATLLVYIPLRAGYCQIAHYGHPVTLTGLTNYFTMYSGRLEVPSLHRLWTALRFLGPVTGTALGLFAVIAGRFGVKRDLPIILALLFLASYRLPDPAGQMWILLLPLSLRAAMGIGNLLSRSKSLWLTAGVWLAVLASAFSGVSLGNRTEDDITMRWTTDILSSLPPGAVYRPVAHDVNYAAYAVHTLGLRGDIILSDPFGNYFELLIPAPAPQWIGERPVFISRAWNRIPVFTLKGLIFQPEDYLSPSLPWEEMDIFRYQGVSPDPMAMDIVAEAWARRMLQEPDASAADSFYRRAADFAATELTGRRIENLRNH